MTEREEGRRSEATPNTTHTNSPTFIIIIIIMQHLHVQGEEPAGEAKTMLYIE